MKPLRLLLIDDDLALLHTVADYLRATLSTIVTTAASVPAALSELERSGPFDVVISDYDLPPHTAHDLEEHLRSSRIFTPMILHSGFHAIDQARFHKPSFLGLVSKPGHREIVAKILESFPQAKKT